MPKNLNKEKFAKTAKNRFEKGTMEDKKMILQALGSNLILKDRPLRVELNKPLTLVKSMTPEAKAIEARLEPLFSDNHTGTQDKISKEFAKNKLWWGWLGQIRTFFIENRSPFAAIV